MRLTVTGKQIDIGETLQTHVGDALVTSNPDDLAGPLRQAVRSGEAHDLRADVPALAEGGIAAPPAAAADVALGRLTPGEAIMRKYPEESQQRMAGKSAQRRPGAMHRPRDGNIDCIDPRGIRGTL